MLLDILRKWFHPDVKADPKLEHALQRVETESENLKTAVADAEHRGAFIRMNRSAEEDAARIRRRGAQ